MEEGKEELELRLSWEGDRRSLRGRRGLRENKHHPTDGDAALCRKKKKVRTSQSTLVCFLHTTTKRVTT